MEIQYKAANIAKAERIHNTNFFEVLDGFGKSSPSVTNVLFVLEAGGVSEEEAGEIVDSQGLVGAIKMVLEALQGAGFLANAALDETQKAELQKQANVILQTTGEKAKA